MAFHWSYVNEMPALAAGSGPDTFQIPAGQVLTYALSGVLQPLDAKVASAKQIEADFVPGSIERLLIDGKYYGFPVDTQTIVLFYNPKLFKDAGLDPDKPPQTWDETIKYAKLMTERDASGVTTQMGLATGGYGPVIASLMIRNGVSTWNAQADLPDFDSPKAAEALQFAADILDDGPVPRHNSASICYDLQDEVGGHEAGLDSSRAVQRLGDIHDAPVHHGYP